MVNKFSNIKDRVIIIAENQSISKEKFFDEIGVTSANFRGKAKETPLNSNAIVNILSKYPDINPDWLLTGKGEMLRKKKEEHQEAAPVETVKKHRLIPLIPIEAMAGYGNGEVQVSEADITEGYEVPEFEERGVKYLIRVSGSSMYPKYSNGDLLGCKPIKDLSFFQWGKVYVLDTDQGPLVKRIFQVDNDSDSLLCKSENFERYPPFTIPKSSIYRIAIIVGVIRLE